MIPFQATGLDRAEVRERIDRVLAREEFRRSGSAVSRWLGERLHDLGEWLRNLLGIADPDHARLAVLAAFGLLALALLWILGCALARRIAFHRESAAESGPNPEALRAATVEGLRRAARTAAEAGDHIGALRLYFRALVVGLSERGELSYRESWTNRELLERGAPRPDVLPLLASLVPRLDAQSFGRVPATPDDVARLAEICERTLDGRRGAAA